MKTIIICFAFILSLSAHGQKWYNNFDSARIEADKNHKMLLVSFSGSDWCVPCIRMHKVFFNATEFENYAQTNLILMNADFPRLKKNRLPKEVEKQNDLLAARFNKAGSFPLTLLLNGSGQVIKKWEGYPQETVAQFINEIQSCQNNATQ